jgi:tetratricopeptide (TPR) repeat protein
MLLNVSCYTRMRVCENVSSLISSCLVWNLYETVLKNALVLNEMDLADLCLEAIQSQFGESARVRKLEALVLEGKEDFDTSEVIYNEIVSDDPTDQFALRRLIAIRKASNDIAGAITRLNEYLKIYMTDSDAYGELADLYLSVCEYKKAAFCVEELIIIDPNNPLYFSKYADIMYTLGDYLIARKYYAQSINMLLDGESEDPQNAQLSTLRPVYGLLVTCNALASINKFDSTGSNTKKNNTELHKLAETLLVKNYLKHQSCKKVLLPALENLLK